MPVGQDVVVSITRVPRLLHRKDIERMAPDMSQVDDICRLWSERHDVSEIARVTGHDRKTVCKYLRADGFSPEPPIPRPRGASRLGSYKGWIDRTLEVNLHDWRMFLIASKLGI